MHRYTEAWVLWAHLPQNPDWSLSGYQKIMTIETVEHALTLYQHLPEALVQGCMLFLMRENITPLWEDERNKNGGFFSYKVNKNIAAVWRDVSFSMMGTTLSIDNGLNQSITGISISPKKNFCILKVWTGNRKCVDPTKIKLLKSDGCIFKEN
jgi:hypothetical protein